MNLTFERGNSDSPRGHALAYFRVLGDQEKILATYIVALPIAMDVAKYVPPLLVPHIADLPSQEFSAFSLPPVPEEVESYDYLVWLAELREDDILYCGALASVDVPVLLQAASDVVKYYSDLWLRYTESASPSRPSLGVQEVLYSLMGDKDKLTELVKMIGKLRFAGEQGGRQLLQETEDEIAILSPFLSKTYRLDYLLQAAKNCTPEGANLAQLYIERCYKLCDEDYGAVKALEDRIAAMETLH